MQKVGSPIRVSNLFAYAERGKTSVHCPPLRMTASDLTSEDTVRDEVSYKSVSPQLVR